MAMRKTLIFLMVKFHPPCCWVGSISHTGENEHQTGKAGLKAGKYQLPRNDTASKG